MESQVHGATDCMFSRYDDFIQLQYEHRGHDREDDAYFKLDISIERLTEAVSSLKGSSPNERYQIGTNKDDVILVPKGSINDPDFSASICGNARVIKLGAKCLDKLLKQADSSLVLKKTMYA